MLLHPSLQHCLCCFISSKPDVQAYQRQSTLCGLLGLPCLEALHILHSTDPQQLTGPAVGAAGWGLAAKRLRRCTHVLGLADLKGLQQCMSHVCWPQLETVSCSTSSAGWLLPLRIIRPCLCSCAMLYLLLRISFAGQPLLNLGPLACSALAAGWTIALPGQLLSCAAYPKQLAMLSGLRTCGWLIYSSSTAGRCVPRALLYCCTGLRTQHTFVPFALCRTAMAYGTVRHTIM